MPKEKLGFEALLKYIPEASFDKVVAYIKQYKVQFTIARDRKTLLGNYQYRTSDNLHRISINGGLNKYSFLITFIHELAHLLTLMQYKNKVEPHGREWQSCYSTLLEEFLQLPIFMPDLVVAIRKMQHKPGAGTSAEPELMKALSKYDDNPHNLVFVEQVPINSIFITEDGKQFTKGVKQRTRHVAVDVITRRHYLFNGLHKVKLADSKK